MSKKKQHKAPKKKKWATKVTTKSDIAFNLAQMVHNYAMIKRLIGLFNQSVDDKGRHLYPESRDFFSGMVKGYDDWFDVLKVDQERFDAVFEKLDKSNIIADADATYIRIVDDKKKSLAERKAAVGRILMPGSEITSQDVSVAKQIFDRQISKVNPK